MLRTKHYIFVLSQTKTYYMTYDKITYGLKNGTIWYTSDYPGGAYTDGTYYWNRAGQSKPTLQETLQERAILDELECIGKEQSNLYDLADHAQYIGNYELAARLQRKCDRLDNIALSLERSLAAYL